MKAKHPLMPFIYSEAVCLFSIFYQVRSMSEFVVLDCDVYPQLNGYRGQIQSFKHQSGRFIVTVNNTEFNSPSSPGSVVVQLCSQYMEPLHRVKNFGISNSGAQRSKEVVSLPNLVLFSNSQTTTFPIMTKFYWKLFELLRKRFIRPEKTPKHQSTNVLLGELSKMDDRAILKNHRIMSDKAEYTTLQQSFTSFTMPFHVFDQSLFKSGCDLSFFDLEKNMDPTLTSNNWDDLLHKVYVAEGSIELNKRCFDTLTPGQSLDSAIIDLCLKW